MEYVLHKRTWQKFQNLTFFWKLLFEIKSNSIYIFHFNICTCSTWDLNPKVHFYHSKLKIGTTSSNLKGDSRKLRMALELAAQSLWNLIKMTSSWVGNVARILARLDQNCGSFNNSQVLVHFHFLWITLYLFSHSKVWSP